MDAEKMADDILPGEFLPGGLTRVSMAKIKRAIDAAIKQEEDRG